MDELRPSKSPVERITALEVLVRGNEATINDHGGVLDHLVNTIDSLILPTQRRHTEEIAEHRALTSESHEWILAQKGAWQLIQRAGIVIAALASLATLVMKLRGH